MERGVRSVGERQQTDAQHGADGASQKHSPLTGGRLRNHKHPDTTQLLVLLTHSSGVDTHDLSTPLLGEIVYVHTLRRAATGHEETSPYELRFSTASSNTITASGGIKPHGACSAR